MMLPSHSLPRQIQDPSRSGLLCLISGIIFGGKGHGHKQISRISVLKRLRPLIPSLTRLAQKLPTHIQYRLGLAEQRAVHEPVLIHLVDKHQLQQGLQWETVPPAVPYKTHKAKRVGESLSNLVSTTLWCTCHLTSRGNHVAKHLMQHAANRVAKVYTLATHNGVTNNITCGHSGCWHPAPVLKSPLAAQPCCAWLAAL